MLWLVCTCLSFSEHETIHADFLTDATAAGGRRRGVTLVTNVPETMLKNAEAVSGLF